MKGNYKDIWKYFRTLAYIFIFYLAITKIISQFAHTPYSKENNYESICDSLYTPDELKRIIPIDSINEFHAIINLDTKIFKDSISADFSGKIRIPTLNFFMLDQEVDRLSISIFFWIRPESTIEKRELMAIKVNEDRMRLTPGGNILGDIYKYAKLKKIYLNEEEDWALVTLNGWINRSDVIQIQKDKTGANRSYFSSCKIPITSKAVGNHKKRQELLKSIGRSWISREALAATVIIIIVISVLFRKSTFFKQEGSDN